MNKPYAKIVGGRIRLSAADGLGHSLARSGITLHWVSEIGLATSEAHF